jgi:hypothetical protein
MKVNWSKAYEELKNTRSIDITLEGDNQWVQLWGKTLWNEPSQENPTVVKTLFTRFITDDRSNEQEIPFKVTKLKYSVVYVGVTNKHPVFIHKLKLVSSVGDRNYGTFLCT